MRVGKLKLANGNFHLLDQILKFELTSGFMVEFFRWSNLYRLEFFRMNKFTMESLVRLNSNEMHLFLKLCPKSQQSIVSVIHPFSIQWNCQGRLDVLPSSPIPTSSQHFQSALSSVLWSGGVRRETRMFAFTLLVNKYVKDCIVKSLYRNKYKSLPE